MSDNDIKEKDEVENQQPEAISESKSMNLVDLLGTTGHAADHATTSGKMGSNDNLPKLSIQGLDSQADHSVAGSSSSLMSAADAKHAGKEAGKEAGKDVAEQLKDLLGGKDVAGQLKDLLGEKKIPNDASIAKKAYQQVQESVSQLPEKLQKAFANLPDAKNGNYSNEQLAFLKQHAGLDAYQSANTYNDSRNRMRANEKGAPGGAADIPRAERPSGAAEGLSRPTRTQTPAERAAAAASGAADGAAEGLSRPTRTETPAERAAAAASGAADGAADGAAEGANRATRPAETPGQRRPADAAADARREQQLNNSAEGREQRPNPTTEEYKAKLQNEMKDAYGSVNKAVAQMKPALQEMYSELRGNKDGSYSQEQLKFLKDHSKEGHLGAVRYNGASDALNSIERVQENREAQNEKRLAFVQAEVAKLSTDLQKEFKSLPMYKNGVGYNQEHVAFLQKHVGKEAAQTMSNYITAQSQIFWGRKK